MKSKCCGATLVVYGDLTCDNPTRRCVLCGKEDWTADGESAADEILKKCFDNPPLSPELRTRIELEALITEREAMLAENEYQAFNHEIQRYSVSDFGDIAERIRELLKGER